MSTTPQDPIREAVDLALGSRKLLTVQEVAQSLKVGEATAWTLVGSGQIPSIKIGKLRRIPVGAVDAFIESQLAQGAAC